MSEHLVAGMSDAAVMAWRSRKGEVMEPATRHWTVRVYSLRASYTLETIHADTRENAIRIAKAMLRREGNTDMVGWSFSAVAV